MSDETIFKAYKFIVILSVIINLGFLFAFISNIENKIIIEHNRIKIIEG